LELFGFVLAGVGPHLSTLATGCHDNLHTYTISLKSLHECIFLNDNSNAVYRVAYFLVALNMAQAASADIINNFARAYFLTYGSRRHLARFDAQSDGWVW
jgi:hypothetical protein